MTNLEIELPLPVDAQRSAIHIFSAPIAYLAAWDLQVRLHHERVQNLRSDTVLILEHQPVYTLGRSTKLSHVPRDPVDLCTHGAELHRVNRGGSVTYHGPGQIVVYPILKLTHHASGPKQLVWLLEEAMIQLLNRWGIAASRIIKKPGVWVLKPEPKKIGFLGIRIEQGVTLHGLALNADLDLAPFQLIQPCGFSDCLVTSMAAVSNTPVSVPAIKHQLAEIFRTMFALNWIDAA